MPAPSAGPPLCPHDDIWRKRRQEVLVMKANTTALSATPGGLAKLQILGACIS